jgi:excisionase family DNA binding protein
MDEINGDDAWLTLAEIAEELRLSPVTVRSWVSKGKLRAKRAGQRKWLVRRSDLQEMLDGEGGSPPLNGRPNPLDVPDEIVTSMAETADADARIDREQWYGMASYDWEVALEQSRMAPPDARFPGRIRHIAQAAAARAAAVRECMEDPAFAWSPVPGSKGMTLSYELRPGGNRPGPKDAWERFDRVVARLGDAMESASARVVASALSDLGRAMSDLADAIEQRPPRALSSCEPRAESRDPGASEGGDGAH